MPKRIGLKRTTDGAAGTGTIERISFDEDNKATANITVRHGPKPKKDKHGMTKGPWPETTHLTIPAAMARGLATGDRVRIKVEKA